MSKIKLGDIYMLDTKKGVALFQLVNLPDDKTNDVEMIKVSYELFEVIPFIDDEIFSKGSFFVKFPVKAALKKKIIKLIGRINLPSSFKIPIHFRTEHYFKMGYWIILNIKNDTFVEVEGLNEDEIKLSPDGVWNDNYLRERLEEGWRLESWC